MPVARQQYDFSLNGKGFILAREKSQRAWSRTGIPDVAQHMLAVDIRRGYLDPIVNRPDVWNDWSGGFGDAYRDASRPNRYHWSENFEPRFPFQLVHCQKMIGDQSNVESMATMPPRDSGNKPYAAYGDGRLVALAPQGMSGSISLLNEYEYDAGTGLTIFNQFQFLGSLIRRPVLFGSYYYVGVLEATGFVQVAAHGSFSTGLSPFTLSSAPMPGRVFVSAGNRLWRAHGPVAGQAIYLQSCAAGADPTVTANWSATLNLGTGRFSVLDGVSLLDQVYLGLNDGLYAGDQTGTFYNVTPEVAGNYHPDNCRDLAIYENSIALQSAMGVLLYKPSLFGGQRGEVEQLNADWMTSRSPVRGIPRCVAGVGDWLYTGIWTGSQSWIVAGSRHARTGRFIWHTLQRVPGTQYRIGRILADTAVAGSTNGFETTPRIAICGDPSLGPGYPSGPNLNYWRIPRLDGNPLNAELYFSANYNGSARMDLGITDGGVPGIPKVYRAFEVWSEALTGTAGGQWCDIYYALDGSTFTYLDTAATSPYSILYFPSTTGSFTTGQGIEISVRSFTASAGVTPVYRAFTLRSALRPNSIDMIEARALIGDGLRDRYGHEMRDGKTMILDLRQMAIGASPVTLIDLAGAASQVMVMAPIDEQEVWQEGDERPQLIATVRMAALQYTRGVAA